MNYFVHNTALSKAPSFHFQSENPAQELAAQNWRVRAEKWAESVVGAGSWWEEASDGQEIAQLRSQTHVSWPERQVWVPGLREDLRRATSLASVNGGK